MIDATAVETYLHERIPMSRLMGIQVISCDDTGLRLSAPLAPNINHRGTVFGGSASAVAMLAGWGFAHACVADLPFAVGLVIRRSSMEFDAPIEADFHAWCAALSADAMAAFQNDLADKGKARLHLSVELLADQRCAATFAGVYVALKD